MKFKFFSINLLKKHKLHLSRLFCCNHTCYCVYMVSVRSASRYITSATHYIAPASRYHPRYLSKSIDVHPWSNSTEFCGLGRGSSDYVFTCYPADDVFWPNYFIVSLLNDKELIRFWLS